MLKQADAREQLVRIGQACPGVEGREEIEGFPDFEAVGQRGLLQLEPDPLSQLMAGAPRVEPQHPNRALVGFAQPFETFNGRRLARAVRA